jgi:hypothetical protein
MFSRSPGAASTASVAEGGFPLQDFKEQARERLTLAIIPRSGVYAKRMLMGRQLRLI